MLVLTRRKNEVCIITCPDGQRIEVHIKDIVPNRIHLGFIAPAEYRIMRKEVQDTIDSVRSAQYDDDSFYRGEDGT